MEQARTYVGRSATEIARAVQKRDVSAVDVVRGHLEQIGALDSMVGAFQLVAAESALADATALDAHDDLDRLPLAGVPVAIKDTIEVEGLPLRLGSLATSRESSTQDDEIVRRIRSAGGVVMGKTKVPELCAWGWTDSAFGVSRNPWDLDRTPGGSSGGSAAAVSAGLVPVAHGSDGGGSIRIPSACCGLVGIKPGPGVVPSAIEGGGWRGLSSDGPLATTVDDLSTMLAVMADRPELAECSTPSDTLRIAWSVAIPAPGKTLDPVIEAVVAETVDLMRGAGHEVFQADPPENRELLGSGVRAMAGIAESARDLPIGLLERRTRAFVRAGRLVDRFGLVRDGQRDRWREELDGFFRGVDLLLTPTLAAPPIAAEGWSRRSVLANSRMATFMPFTGRWNLAGYPAMSVPAGVHPCGVPLAVQLIAPDGGEALILSVARQLEELRPWRRHAPLSGIESDSADPLTTDSTAV